MSSSRPETCSVCKEGNIEFLATVDAYICDNCSLVLGSDIESHGEFEDQQDEGEHGESDSSSWLDDVSPIDKSEENLVNVLKLVETHCSSLDLPTSSEIECAEIMAQAWQTNFMHGRTVPGVLGAAIYMASLSTDQAIPPGQVASEVNVDSNKMLRTYRKLRRELDLQINPPEPSDYLSYLCRKNGFDNELKAAAEVLCNNTKHAGNPVGIACAAIYNVAAERGQNVTLRGIATSGCVTKETVWKHRMLLQ